MATRTCKVGVHGRNAERYEDADYQVIRDARLEVVKMMSQSEPEVFRRLQAENPNLELITRLYHPSFGVGHHPAADEFANAMIPVMQRLQPYCAQFQVHNEPNHVHRYEGWGSSDDDARDFNQWFLAVHARLKQACPWASLGFPGLAVPDPLHRDRAWLQLCRPAIQAADWLGCHCYWQSPPGGGSVMLADHSGLCFKYYHEAYPDKAIHILECGNSNGQGQGFPTHQELYADEYVRWLAEVFQFSYIGSASFFILSSPDPVWDAFAWRTRDGIKQRIVGAIAAMARPALQPLALASAHAPAAAGVHSGVLPRIFTNQMVIDAFYNVAQARGVGDWAILNAAGLDVAQLAQDRTGLYQGPALESLPNLSDDERTQVAADLIRQARARRLWRGSTTAEAGLNLRAGPGTDRAVLAGLPFQTAVDVLAEQGDWLFVATDAGDGGYVAGAYVAAAEAAMAQEAIPVAAAPPPPVPTSLVNVNTASVAELMTLPGIGPVRAQIMVAHRPFATVDDLVRAPGIGNAVVSRIRRLVGAT